MNKEQLEKEIEEVKRDMEYMKSQHAQPYMKGFKRLYLWDDPKWENLYSGAQNKMASLLMQKRALER